MNNKYLRLPSVSRLLMTASVAVVLSLYATSAQAAVGCNDKVMKAMQAKAEAKVAQDVAVTESVITKPDSVLAMTCFNQTAGTLAKTGGGIFSGDFTQQLAPLVTEGLNSFFDDFAGASGFNGFLEGIGGSVGNMMTNSIGSGLSNMLGDFGGSGAIGNALDIFGQGSSTVNSTTDQSSTFADGIMSYATQLVDTNTATDSKCEGIKGLWDGIKGKGIVKMPKLTMSDLMSITNNGGTPDLSALPQGIQDMFANTEQAAGDNPHLQNFRKNLEASSGIFQQLNEAVADLPTPTPPINFQAQDLNSSCTVLAAAGIIDPSECN